MDIPRGHVPVIFDDQAFADDIQRASAEGTSLANATKAQLERTGAPIARLRRCNSEGRDGTRLDGCFKLYLPAPAGRFGLVLRLAYREHAVLRYLAFGVRHHPAGSHAPTVYQLAHQRLHGG